jgi:hypothetical protein
MSKRAAGRPGDGEEDEDGDEWLWFGDEARFFFIVGGGGARGRRAGECSGPVDSACCACQYREEKGEANAIDGIAMATACCTDSARHRVET